MTIDIIIKIAALGIVISILNQVLKHSGRDDQAFFISLAGVLIVLTWIIPYIVDVFKSLQQLFKL